MAYLDPQEAFEHFKERVVSGIQQHFPIKGKTQTLELDGIEVKDTLSHDDLRAQHKAKVAGASYAVPVYGKVVLRDNATGSVVSTQRMRLSEIPKMTSRLSYIVDGQEYQVDNQWQLKPGVYGRRRDNGELETRFNVTGKRSFDVHFDPESKRFRMEYGKAKIPVYPLVKALGVSDQEMEKAWGKEIFAANKSAPLTATALERFYKADRKQAPASREEAEKHFVQSMEASKLRTDSTAITLGKPFAHVTGETLQLATKKLLDINNGHPEDDRDALIFKDLRTVGDFAYEKLAGGENRARVLQKTARKLSAAKDVRDVLKSELFSLPLKQTFTKNAASRCATQINPVEMISSAQQTTIMGPGGIQSERSVTDEAKLVNPSHLGFLDPIHTPEGEKTGVTLRLPLGVKKVGNEARIPLYNLVTKSTELVSPTEFVQHGVVLPDQVRWENGHPKPLSPNVKMSAPGNEIREGKLADARYVMRDSSQLFNMTSNLIPFLGNTSGNRASMGSRQMEQSISLLHREAPLVQVATGVDHPDAHTFERMLGKNASHSTPIAGKVTSVHADGIHIKGADGKTHEVQIYNNYPLNDAKSVMHSTPLVKVGDSVKAGQVVADTNFSKNGTIALGTNLRVAYIPYKGYNFEDGVVISESAAKKLSSEHLHKHQVPITPDLKVGAKSFQVLHPGTYKDTQIKHIGEDGVAKVGSRVNPGDPLLLATKPYDLKERVGLGAIRKSMSGTHTDKSLKWEGEVAGEVVGVHKAGDKIQVHVRTIEPMQVGDKIAGRYGNKGIITSILPDTEMPHDKQGKHVEVALNPSGVPGRMNVGQLLETAASKIALKTGKPYVVKNFQHGVDMLGHVQSELKKHGLSDTEALYDPTTKQHLGETMVGHQHIFKLVHQVDKKLSVRSGMSLPGTAPETYDLNLQPASGSGTGGQSMGSLGMYALLAHGAKANIREMQTYKSEGPDPQTNPGKKWQSDHNQIWAAIQTGAPLPTPKSSFAFAKFQDYLKGTGVNIEKKGHEFVLSPLTDKQILELARHPLPKAAERLKAKVDASGEYTPQPGGLFDEKLTGGLGGRQWSRIPLAEPIPNPVFEEPIKRLLGLKASEFDSIVQGHVGVAKDGRLGTPGVGHVTGGAGIKRLLDQIDVKKDLAKAKDELATTKGPLVDKVLKKVKYLTALDKLGTTASEAYILHNLPVVPPVMRPVSPMPDGNLKYADLNHLYSQFALVNDKLGDPTLRQHLTDAGKVQLRNDLYSGVKALMGMGVPYADADHKGILHTISGAQPKSGFFQSTLMNRRQDLTMRSTIVPEPALGLDEVGLPKDAALDLYRPFVVKKLVDMGVARTALDAPSHLQKKGPAVWKALQHVMDERPVIMKRDPALHKYSVQGFKPKMVAGNAIQIHPLVCGGFNADFDGDTMALFVPIHKDAVEEAHKMMPTKNLFSEATGKVMYQPTLESALGLFKLTQRGKDTSHKFDSPFHAIDAVRQGKVAMTDVVHVEGQKTTPGRVLLAAALPEPMRKPMLTDLDAPLHKKGLDTLLTTLAKNHTDHFGNAVNDLKDLGNGASYGAVALPRPASEGHSFIFGTKQAPGAYLDPKSRVYLPVGGTHTLSLSDFETDKASRDKALTPAHKKVQEIYAGRGTLAQKDQAAVRVYDQASKEMRELHEGKAKKDPSNLFVMYQAGVKPGWDQYKQMTLAPMLLKDSSDRVIPTPVTRSYSEGLDVGGYWTQMHGARRGSVMKVQEVREPGAMSKLLMNSMMNINVTASDCGTSNGIALPVHDKEVHDRHLAQDFRHNNLHLPAGTMLSPDVVGRIRAAKPDARLLVRSPLKCEDEKGVCQHCAGLNATGQHHEMGTAVGVHAAHAVGERAIQLTLKAFHTGGVQEAGGGKLLNSFGRFEQLMNMPKKIPFAASLAMESGKITGIHHTPTGVDIEINGKKHHVGKDAAGTALHTALPGASPSSLFPTWTPPKVGDHVEAGHILSDPNRTYVNPHDLYKATKSIERVQHHLTNEVYDLYKDEGIRRRAVETVVRGMGNLTKIQDPGDHDDVMRGEFRTLTSVHKINKGLVAAGKNPIEHTPVLKGLTVLPLAAQEDWMAKLQHRNLRETIVDAAATMGRSHIHGTHPVPGMAFGAEFGLNSGHALRPGMGHLKDVPKHNY